MRHKYKTPAIVLRRFPLGEANVSLLLLSPELGLVKARAQGVRTQGAKLASSLQTLSELDAMLIRGQEGWRVGGAVCITNWNRALSSSARLRAGRVAGLLTRLVRGETYDLPLYEAYRGFLSSLLVLNEEEQEAAECLVALRIVHFLGHDGGDGIGAPDSYDVSLLPNTVSKRRAVIARINNGISASGL
jgi:recombinational DNA repair protein (RecF pathway)